MAGPSVLDKFTPQVIENFDNPNWGELIEVELTLDEIKSVQKNMVRHYEDSTPWYMDGYEVGNRDKLLVAFGADDGEDGRIFQFDRSNRAAFNKVVEYARSKGIPEEQMDFLEK